MNKPKIGNKPWFLSVLNNQDSFHRNYTISIPHEYIEGEKNLLKLKIRITWWLIRMLWCEVRGIRIPSQVKIPRSGRR